MRQNGWCLLLTAWALLTVLAAGPALGQDAANGNEDAKARLDALLAAAQKLHDDGNYAAAREKLSEVFKLAPAHPGAVRLASSIDAALERERLSLYRQAAFEEDASTGAVPSATAAAAALLAATQPAKRPGDSGHLYALAEELLEKGHHDAARRTLAEIGPDDKEFEKALVLKARIDAWEARNQATVYGTRTREIDRDLERRLERDLESARQLFNRGRWAEAIDACEKIRRYAPDDARVRALMQDASIELTDARVRDIQRTTERRLREVIGETEEIMTPPPDLPKLTRPKLEPEPRVPTSDEIELEKKLNEKVSVDLIEAPLSYLLSRSMGINIIVDPTAVQNKTLTINVQNVTLREVLDFITRNEGVSFTKGKNTIYVTTPDQPMLTMRIFHLSKGLTDATHDITPQGAINIAAGAGGAGGRQQQQRQQQPQDQDAMGPGAKPSMTSDIERLLDQLPLLIEWPTGSTYYLDRKRNVLFLRSTPQVLDQVEKMIEALDENPIQVLVMTRFIEVDAETYDDIGTQWNLTNDYPLSKKGGQNSLVIDASTGTIFDARVSTGATDTVSSADGFTFGLTGILTNVQFQLTLKALLSKYKGRIINAPSIIASNNTPARIQESEDIWYVRDYDIDRTELTGAEGVTTSEPVIIPVFDREPGVGFGLTVTPSVGKDSRDITLLIEPVFRKKSLTSVTSPLIIRGEPGTPDIERQIERPVIVDRRMWVKVTVRDGYHVALGGMVTAASKEIEAKVPILGDIPLLGWLFRRRTTLDVKRRLLIFVSAKILTPQGRMYKTEDEEREERERELELTGAAGLPKGLGFEYVKTKETRQGLGPPVISPPSNGVIEVREVGQ